MRIISWIKTHKLSSLLLAIILSPFIMGIWSNMFGVEVSNLSLPRMNSQTSSVPSYSYDSGVSKSYPAPGSTGGGYNQIAPLPPSYNTPVSSGMVMRSSNLSLLVSDVRKMADNVRSQAEALGGFMVDSNFSNPGEAPNASVTVRVPAGNLEKYLTQLRSQAIRVTSENLDGYDISDQYTDIQKRLDTLNRTREKFEAIYAKAVEIQDILNVQSRLIENQNEIDQLKGQVQYMEKSVQLAKVSVNLSTDDLALPYDSDSSWRPVVVIKQALRSLISTLHDILNFVIWVAVYAIIWIPLLIIVNLIRKARRKKNDLKKS